MYFVAGKGRTVADCTMQRWLSSVSLAPCGLLIMPSWCSSHWASLSPCSEPWQSFVTASAHPVLGHDTMWLLRLVDKNLLKEKNILREVEISSWLIEKRIAENEFGSISPVLAKENRQDIKQAHFLVPSCEAGKADRALPWISKTSLKHSTSLSWFCVSQGISQFPMQQPWHCHWGGTDLGKRRISWFLEVKILQFQLVNEPPGLLKFG